jgi:hypothetical protein
VTSDRHKQGNVLIHQFMTTMGYAPICNGSLTVHFDGQCDMSGTERRLIDRPDRRQTTLAVPAGSERRKLPPVPLVKP